MYLTGSLSIDPSQLTHIDKIKPQKAFKRMLYVLTSGKVADKVEHETFCAISILQQVNAAMRKAGVTNIVRLAKDGVDFYLDETGKDDDIEAAMDGFKLEVDKLESELFSILYLILEHEDKEFKYLIEIKINRSHAVGAYPIEIIVNGLIKDYRMQDGEAIPQSMQDAFSSQDKYDSVQTHKKSHFKHFIHQLDLAIKTYIQVDDVQTDHGVSIIRPTSKVKSKADMKPSKDISSPPIYHGYHGFSDFVLYTWMWSSMCHSHNIYLNDFTLVDEDGVDVMDIGDTGFNAADGDTMNVDETITPPSGADISPSEGFSDSVDTSSGSGWFGGDSGDSGGSDGGGSDGGGCSSCGGGCGGCG